MRQENIEAASLINRRHLEILMEILLAITLKFKGYLKEFWEILDGFAFSNKCRFKEKLKVQNRCLLSPGTHTMSNHPYYQCFSLEVQIVKTFGIYLYLWLLSRVYSVHEGTSLMLCILGIGQNFNYKYLSL